MAGAVVRLLAALVLLTGCAATTTVTDSPAPSAAPGVKRYGPAVSTVRSLGRRDHARRPSASRSLRRRPVSTARPLQNWPALAQCESGGNPRAVDPSGHYFGLYQFDVQTWRSIGGTGLPSDASPAEQTARAELLYASRGPAPWPACGSNL